MKIRMFAIAAAAVGVVAAGAVAVALTVATVVVHGHGTPVRATLVGGQYYLNAYDVARAFGHGASFDSNTRTLYTSPILPRVTAGADSNGYIAVSIGRITRPSSYNGNEPDPSYHFEEATLRVRNVSHAAAPLYNLQLELMQGQAHLNSGQLYESNGADLVNVDTPAGASHAYRVVFEVADGSKPDGILIHPPAGFGADLLIRI